MKEHENELQKCRAELIEQKALVDGYKDALEQITHENKVKLAEQQELAHR